MRLWAPPLRPGARRDPAIAGLVAEMPAGGGVVDVAFAGDARHVIRQAIAEHRLGLVDPIPGEFVAPLHWAMRLDPRMSVFVGPEVHFDVTAIEWPTVPVVGMTLREAAAAYLAAVPASVPLPARVAVRHFADVSPAWRRTVSPPRGLNCQRNPLHYDRWRRFERDLRALPSPARLRKWYADVRTGM